MRGSCKQVVIYVKILLDNLVSTYIVSRGLKKQLHEKKVRYIYHINNNKKVITEKCGNLFTITPTDHIINDVKCQMH